MTTFPANAHVSRHAGPPRHAQLRVDPLILRRHSAWNGARFLNGRCLSSWIQFLDTAHHGFAVPLHGTSREGICGSTSGEPLGRRRRRVFIRDRSTALAWVANTVTTRVNRPAYAQRRPTRHDRGQWFIGRYDGAGPGGRLSVSPPAGRVLRQSSSLNTIGATHASVTNAGSIKSSTRWNAGTRGIGLTGDVAALCRTGPRRTSGRIGEFCFVATAGHSARRGRLL
jgi:hypothetical protein